MFIIAISYSVNSIYLTLSRGFAPIDFSLILIQFILNTATKHFLSALAGLLCNYFVMLSSIVLLLPYFVC